MSKERNTDFTLNSLDDLFTSQNERDNGYLPDIQDIPLELLDDFPNHPFKVRDDEDMLKLVESVSERGVLVPAIVRPKADGRYELISGHRRKKASEYANKKTLRCIVSDMADDAATIIMVDSNIQRTDILPSEKAFAYKMKLDAMKHQGERTDLTSVPVGQKFSRKELSEETGDSQTQIQRYIRLTNLVPELLEMVDEGKIKMRPAVEISYLDEDSQRDLVDAIDTEDCTPSHAQTIKMRKFFSEGKLNADVIASIMQEEKGIRFIKSDYTPLFTIADGGKIEVTALNGEKITHTCRYIDDYHLEVGKNLYHICEFAERMESVGSKVEPKAEEKTLNKKSQDRSDSR